MTGTDRDGAPMEQWIHARQIQADGIVEQFAPTWHVSTPEEVSLIAEAFPLFDSAGYQAFLALKARRHLM